MNVQKVIATSWFVLVGIALLASIGIEGGWQPVVGILGIIAFIAITAWAYDVLTRGNSML